MSQPNNRSRTRKSAQPQEQTSSPEAREKDLKRVKKIVDEATDIRKERVEAAKLALKQGKLNLKGKELAEKILSDPLNQIDIEI